MLFNREQVLEKIPHRDPFLFVDSIDSVTEHQDVQLSSFKNLLGIEAVGRYRTKKNHPIFTGHFPGMPIFPGVVQIEMMAQVSSLILLSQKAIDWKNHLSLALLGVEGAKFRRPIFPEMDLKIITRCIKARTNIVISECKVFNNDIVHSEAICMTSVTTLKKDL